MGKKLVNVQKQIGRSTKGIINNLIEKTEIKRSAKGIIDNFESDDVIIINKDSYKFKRRI